MSFIATKEVSDTPHGRAAQVSPRPERVYSRFDLTVRGDLD